MAAVIPAAVSVTIAQLADEIRLRGTASTYFGQTVSVARAIITSPIRQSTTSVRFEVADPSAGNQPQLTVRVLNGGGHDASFASIFDDATVVGRFTRIGSAFQIAVEDATRHSIAQNRGGLAFEDYARVQAAWRSTSNNPEGAVRVLASSGYTFMVPLPLFLDHPMWNGNPPRPPRDSGNEQDHSWNATAQRALGAWLAVN